ncbi:MAG TPA: hypothetical protein VF788_08680, partial [Pseudonocardiaceae bacterium]
LHERQWLPRLAPTPHTVDQPKMTARHAALGAVVHIEQDVVIEGDLTRPTIASKRDTGQGLLFRRTDS